MGDENGFLVAFVRESVAACCSRDLVGSMCFVVSSAPAWAGSEESCSTRIGVLFVEAPKVSSSESEKVWTVHRKLHQCADALQPALTCLPLILVLFRGKF